MMIDLQNKNVPDGFQLGSSRRKDLITGAGPMRFSAYKIREHHRKLMDLEESVAQIGKSIRSQIIPHAFRHCMGYEAEEWMQEVPTYVGHQLAYDFSEVLHGLVGDGIPQAVVNELIKKTKQEVDPILELGEIARLELMESWHTVAADLGGRSTTDEFLSACIRLVDGARETIESHEGGSHVALSA